MAKDEEGMAQKTHGEDQEDRHAGDIFEANHQSEGN